MKKVLAIIMAVGMLLSCTLTGYAAQASSEDYITLQGDWHFKLYRKYSQMFQYLAYNRCTVTWEDTDLAAVPGEDTYGGWETVETPSPDYSTGGLLQMTRDGSTTDNRNELLESDLFPKWSEAWMCRTLDLPDGFLQEDNVTLLLGIVDDMDVVYVNGAPVAASGFVDATGARSLAVPSLGGFEQKEDFRFEKSYWEVSREYKIPASYFHEGENEIAIRVYNNNSFGGFYDRTMALCATEAAVRELKGLPTQELVNKDKVQATVTAQVAALQSEDLNALGETVYDGYVEDGVSKEKLLAQWAERFEGYTDITVTDTNSGYYQGQNNTYYYSANRVVTGTNADGKSSSILSDAEWLQCFVNIGGKAVERGNWSRCYTVTYPSELMNNNLQYSVYLPKGYYEQTDRSYPVVYLLHGINSTGKSFVDVDRIESKMDSWIGSGKVVDMIVVMPNSGKNSFYTDTPLPSNGVGSDTAGPWATHITSEIRAEIEQNYRTLQEAAFRGISGISMGGGGAFKLGGENPELYSSVASHMGAVSSTSIEILDTLSDEQLEKYDFYLDCGKKDAMVQPANTKLVGEYLEGRKARVSWELREGGHNSAFYMTGMPRSMELHSKHFVANGLYDIWGVNAPKGNDMVPNEANDFKTLDTIQQASDALRNTDVRMPGRAVVSQSTQNSERTVLIPIDLYSDHAAVSLETMDLLAASKNVGLRIRLDGGKAILEMMGGFEANYDAGRLTYPLFLNDPAPNADRMSAKATTGGQTFKLGGNMLFPTAVTVSLKTTLPAGEKVYLYHFDTDTGRYTLVTGAAVVDGALTFTTRQLGEFVAMNHSL